MPPAAARLGRALLAGWLLLALCPAPSAALDLFAQHEVTVHFATPEGKPMANAEVRVYAPGAPDRPALTGRTDGAGKFEFPADRNGFWSAEARTKGEVARVTVRVGGPDGHNQPLSPYWVIGGLFVLLVIAFLYRIMRARSRRGGGTP